MMSCNMVHVGKSCEVRNNRHPGHRLSKYNSTCTGCTCVLGLVALASRHCFRTCHKKSKTTHTQNELGWMFSSPKCDMPIRTYGREKVDGCWCYILILFFHVQKDSPQVSHSLSPFSIKEAIRSWNAPVSGKSWGMWLEKLNHTQINRHSYGRKYWRSM